MFHRHNLNLKLDLILRQTVDNPASEDMTSARSTLLATALSAKILASRAWEANKTCDEDYPLVNIIGQGLPPSQATCASAVFPWTKVSECDLARCLKPNASVRPWIVIKSALRARKEESTTSTVEEGPVLALGDATEVEEKGGTGSGSATALGGGKRTGIRSFASEPALKIEVVQTED